MLAKDLMRRDVFTVQDNQSVEELLDLLVQEHIHGCPVVNADGELLGVVTQQDIFFSGVTEEGQSVEKRKKMKVGDLMTSPAVSATEETEILGLCRMMHRLRIHRVPIVNNGKVTGIISSLDIIGRLADGERDL